ncbi:type VI secretion system lipoprotein TssJ [Inquilinus sp. CA228]|uniref:type VI secretion system lipoprotein TssJ n=1 Tax=Inquilinus sp. CA228 TaxID=3455609 RepID=UPI003F8D06F3
MRAVGLCIAVAVGATMAGCGSSPTQVALTLAASEQLNPNSENQPSPTVVRIYELKSADAFNAATFDGLFYNDTTTLGADLLGRKEVEVLPGQTVTVDRTAEAGTGFVGVVAGFRTPQGTQWRGTLPVEAEDDNPIQVNLAPSSLTVAKGPSGGFFFGLF